MFVFYDWPFPQTYFAKNVADLFILLIISGSVFSDRVVFYGDTIKAGSQPPNWTQLNCTSLPTYATVTTRWLDARVSVTTWLAERN